jgi:hypothetical protein
MERSAQAGGRKNLWRLKVSEMQLIFSKIEFYGKELVLVNFQKSRKTNRRAS